MADKKETPPVQDTLQVQSNSCPWCVSRVKDYEKEVADMKKDESDYGKSQYKQHSAALKCMQDNKTVRGRGARWQCDGCGKFWDKDALGKPYTLELERGKAWADEMRVKALQGK